MAIKVKARECLLKFKKTDSGYYRYVMQPEIYNQLPAEKVLVEAAQHSGLSISVMGAAWMATGDVVKVWATEGHSVPLPGLGTMRFGNFFPGNRNFSPAAAVFRPLPISLVQLRCKVNAGGQARLAFAAANLVTVWRQLFF